MCVAASEQILAKKAEQKQEPRRPQEKSAVSKLAKCSCSASWYEDFFTNKKRRKRDWQKKFTRQLFIFFIYLPFKNTGLKWVFLLLLQAHQKSKYILQFSLDFSKSVCREWKNKVTISISYSFHPHLIEIVLLLMSFIIIVRRGPVHLSAALVAAQLI